MKPLNAEEKGCNPISSNCVIWQGPNLDCINLCKGDTISDVTYKAATEICRILDILKISNYDLSCLNLTACQPSDFEQLIQLLIQRICHLEECTGCAPSCNAPAPTPPVPADGCPDCEMPISECFYFTNGLGDTVSYLQLKDYVTAIGNKLCALIAAVGTTDAVVQADGNRIGALETQVAILESNPNPEVQITPDCVLPSVPTNVSTVVIALEEQFCLLRDVLGGTANLQTAVLNQCAGLNDDNRLSGSGTMSTIPNWKNTVTSVSDSLTNMWLTICDLRAAVKTIQANCCPTGCAGISLSLSASRTDTAVVIFLTGTIPPSFVECYGNTQVKLTDSAGGSLTTTVSILAILNAPGGYNLAIPIPGPVNPALDITVEINPCLKDPSTGTTCESCLEYYVASPINCPEFVITTVEPNSLTYTFTSNPGSYQYSVTIYETTGMVFVGQNVITLTGVSSPTGSFVGLTPNTSYTLTMTVVPAGCLSCTPAICNTLVEFTDVCPPPVFTSATITVDPIL